MDFTCFSKMAALSASEPLHVLFPAPAALTVHRAHSCLCRCSHQSGPSQPREAFSRSRSPPRSPSLLSVFFGALAFFQQSVCAIYISVFVFPPTGRLCLERSPMHTVGLRAHRAEKAVETHAHLLLRPRSQWPRIKTWTQQSNEVACPVVVSKGTV